MPARDTYHEAVVKALIADGWTITHDPLQLVYGDQDLYVDLGAERGAIAAERDNQRIAVEIKSFLSRSAVEDFQNAMGQFVIYRNILRVTEPERILFLAVPNRTYEGFLSRQFGQFILQDEQVPLIVFDPKNERILKWIR
jgi:hypothetical protein